MRRFLAMLLVGGIGAGVQPEAAAQPVPEHDAQTLIIKFAPHVDGKALAREIALQKWGTWALSADLGEAGVEGLLPVFPRPPNGKYNMRVYDSLGMSQFFVAFLKRHTSVAAVSTALDSLHVIAATEPNYIWHLAGPRVDPNDPVYVLQWHYEIIDLPYAWNITQGSSSVIVGVIDSGIDYNHPDLWERLAVNLTEYAGSPGVDDDLNGKIDDILGWNFVAWNGDPYDDNSHGTHVSGTIAAESNNATGVAGVDWNCLLFSCKVLNAAGSGDLYKIAAAIQYTTDLGCHILNMSVGGTTDAFLYEVANAYALANGVLVVAAMGNDNSVTSLYPAAYPTVLAVGATDALDQRWLDSPTSGSNVGLHIDVCAPGDGILSSMPLWYNPTVPYDYKTGTSMATPHVTGVAALLLSVRPDFTPDSLYHYILGGAQDQIGHPLEDTPGFDIYHGYGRINARRSLELALGCVCWCHADPWCDGVTNVLDVVHTVNPAFRGTAPVYDSDCGYARSDVNCDGVTNVMDVVYVVNVAFRMGTAEEWFCDPCMD